jgi:hypothetical protein
MRTNADMEATQPFFSEQNTRIGFHYYPDTLHYRQSDLHAWLPQLKALNASWLVLKSDVQRAIPEYFISGLVQAGIEPIIQFNLNLERPPQDADLTLLFSAYKKWGANGIILSERPNIHTAWHMVNWTNKDLVQHFLTHYLPLAKLTLTHNLLPLMPPLEPGGNYWDTSFLRSVLESLVETREKDILDHLVLTAYAWTHGQSLNWGAGGPREWPGARPYFTRAGHEDHRGFHVFDWYQTIFQEVLGETCPIFLLQAGAAGDPLQPHDTVNEEQHTDTNMAILRLLMREKLTTPEDPKTMLRAIDDSVVSCNFWLLAAEQADFWAEDAWFCENRRPKPIVKEIERYFSVCQQEENQESCGCGIQMA